MPETDITLVTPFMWRPEDRTTGGSDMFDCSRRDFLRTTVGAMASLTALAPTSVAGIARIAEAASRYSGPFVIVADDSWPPGVANLISQYQKLRPNLQVREVVFGPMEQFPALFSAARVSGEQLDVLMLNGLHSRTYAYAGDLLPLDNKIPYLSRFYSAAIGEARENGHLYGVPTSYGGGFLVGYNNAILAKAGLAEPRSYADFLHIRDVLSKQGISVFTQAGKQILVWGVWFFLTYAQTSGNRSLAKTIDTLHGKRTFTDPEVVEALQLIFNFGKDKLFTPGLNSLDFAGAMAEFLTGKAAFYYFGDSQLIGAVRGQHVPNMDLKLITMPLLVPDKSVRRQWPGALGWPTCLYAKIAPERVPVALDFLNFITSDASNAAILHAASASVGPNTHATGGNDPLYAQVQKLAPDIALYLNWLWPPEVDQAFAEGIAAGVAGTKTALQVAQSIQSVFDGLVAKGYKFA
jgi:ABC-type glycerol-3-phosphate transport system substrate-binding protein